MKNLLYISSLPQDSQSGGANAVNYHIYKQLERCFSCTYVQINPPENIWGKWKSRILRKIIKRPGKFNFFSQRRLKVIACHFDAIEGDYDIIFFRGFTSWVHCRPKVPYVAYNDVHFLQFFRNTFSYDQFSKGDIDRIGTVEKLWLSKAKNVFFESQWGAEQCFKDYGIRPDTLMVIGRGGHIHIPLKDIYDGSLNLLIIANNFYQKGGDLVFDAFQQLRTKYKSLKFHVIGGHPGHKVLEADGVVYHGYLYKEKAEDLVKLVSILSTAFLLMHVTREDTNPLVITEAGYYGCPAISVDKYAIPELIIQNETGILLSESPNMEEISKAIEYFILNEGKYLAFRKKTMVYNIENFSWVSCGIKVFNNIQIN